MLPSTHIETLFRTHYLSRTDYIDVQFYTLSPE